MPSFEVRIRYEGVSVHVVEAPDNGAAERLAELAYEAGGTRNDTGDGWARVINVITSPIPPQEADMRYIVGRVDGEGEKCQFDTIEEVHAYLNIQPHDDVYEGKYYVDDMQQNEVDEYWKIEHRNKELQAEMDRRRLQNAQIRTLKQSELLKCPHIIIVPDHYHEDGSCRCNDETHTEMAEWGYTWDGNQWQAGRETSE